MSNPFISMDVAIIFQGQEYELRKTRYPEGGAVAIVLWDKDTDDYGLVATVNLPDIRIAPNQVFIKNYSENEGMLKALENAGVVKATGEKVRSGFVEIPIAELQGRHREGGPGSDSRPPGTDDGYKRAREEAAARGDSTGSAKDKGRTR